MPDPQLELDQPEQEDYPQDPRQMQLGEVEHEIDLDHLPTVKHNWVKRGIKVSCEGADHPHHSHFLTTKA